MKLSNEDIREMVRLHEELGCPCSAIAKKYGVTQGYVWRKVHFARLNGIGGALHPSERRSLSAEEKEGVVGLVLAGRSPFSLSAEFGVSGSAIAEWVKRYESEGYNGLLRRRKGGSHGEKGKAAEGQGGGTGGAAEGKPAAQAREQEDQGEVRRKKSFSLGPDSTHAEREETARKIDELRQRDPSLRLCDLLSESGLSRKTYYYYRKRRGKPDKHAELRAEIIGIFEASDQSYGYPRVTLELRNRGYSVSAKTVYRIMREEGMNAFKRAGLKGYTSYRGEVGKICKNLLLVKTKTKGGRKVKRRKLHFEKPLMAIATDVTEFKLGDGTKAYFAPVIDLCTQEILSYSVSKTPDMAQQNEMLRGLFERYPDGALNGTIFHSDQGWQYQNERFQRAIREHGMKQSMSRKGNCHDNAVTENFFGRCKNECYYHREPDFADFESAKKTIENYVERYNTKRIQKRLGGKTPSQTRIEFEKAIESSCK